MQSSLEIKYFIYFDANWMEIAGVKDKKKFWDI